MTETSLVVDGALMLYGFVGETFFDEGFSSSQVNKALAGLSGPLTVHVNSGGGYAFEGVAIYNALRSYSEKHGKVTVKIDSVAASAASVIAMAGDDIIMRTGALMMIHNASAVTFGTKQDHEKSAEALGKINDSMVSLYAIRTGQSEATLRSLMDAETWFDGKEAVAKGFATSVETKPAVTATAFDYTLYAKAPRELRAMATVRLNNEGKPEAALSAAHPVTKEISMTDTTIVADITDAAPTINAVQPVAASAATATAVAAERKRTTAIMATAHAGKLPQELVDQHIEAGSSVEAFKAAAFQWKIDTQPDAGASQINPSSYGFDVTSRGTTDRNSPAVKAAAMEDALVAQITGTLPKSDAARPYMNFGFANIALELQGEKQPTGNISAGQRHKILAAAAGGMGTSDFPNLLENALNKVLLERYTASTPTYRELARQKPFNDFRTHPMYRTGDFPSIQPVAESGEIKYGSFGENKESAILKAYAIAIRLSRQLMVNDEMRAVGEVMSDYGNRVAQDEDLLFYTFMATATLNDTLAVWHATHTNLAGAGTAITVAAVSAGRAAMRKQKSIDGKPIAVNASILLVSPDKETEAEQFVAAVQPNQTSSVNPFSGKLRVVVSPHLTGNAWHLFADTSMAGGACFVYGFLDGAEAPRVRFDEPFGQQGMAMSVEHDFGMGAIDYRGTYKNPGA